MKIQLIRRLKFVRNLFSRNEQQTAVRNAGGAPEAWQPLEGRMMMSVSAAPTPLSPQHAPANSIALIDSTLPDQSLLAKSLPSTVDRIVYNPSTQSARQVLTLAADAAKARGTKLDSLLIFSHGNDGEFALGNDIISPRSLQETASQWKSLAGVFANDASIDLYGCDTAAGPSGQKLLDQLHKLTQASVFGSTNITGHDGDWTLEAHSDNADVAHAFASPVNTAALTSYPDDLLITVSTLPTATPNPVTGTSTSLSAVFVDVGHTPTVTWSVGSAPTGGNVTFGSSNGTTTGSNTTAAFTKAGNYTLNVTAADGVNTNAVSNVTVIVNQTLTTLAITPATATTAVGGTQTFVATGYDQFGTAMATAPTVLWSSAHGTITLGGVYTAPGSAMADTVTATSGTITATANVTVSNTLPRVATAASANPSTVTGTTAALSVLGAVGAGESNLTYTWAATTKPTGATVAFSANGTNAAKNSTATFSTPGTYVMTATIADGANTVTSSTPVTVTDSVGAVTLSPGTATVAQQATQTFTAVAYDQFGNPMATQPTFTWSTAIGSVGTVSSSGVYTAPVGTGAATVKATASGVTGTSAVTVYNAAPTVATPAAATTVTPADTSVLTVLGADDAGEANLTYNWATTATPAGGTATFSLNNSNLAKTTTATFNKVGTYTMAATITDSGGLSTSSSVNVTVGAVATTLQVLPGTVANLNENGSETLTTNVLDQFGNTLGVQPNVTYAVTSGTGTVSSGGVFTAPSSAGTNVVQVSAGGLTQNVTINVTNAAPTVVTAATANPNPVTGTTTTLTTLGADDGGEANLTYTWSATAKPAGSTVTFSANGTNAAKSSTATFTAAGAYTLQVAISDGTSTTDSTVLVTVAQTLTTLTVTPPTAALHENGTQQFTAAGTDQFGAAMTVPPVVTWSKASGVGSISLTGLYTAPAGVGTATVSATSGTVVGNASIAVTNAAPTIVTAAAATPNPVAGTTAALSVTATDDGGAANLTYTWSALSKPAGSNPTFSANGTNAAAASVVTFNDAGSYTFQVAVSDGTNVTTSNVTVVVAQTMASIAVSAPAGTLPENGHETLTAVADDQFGNALTVQPTITWNVVGVGASIDSSGDLTASPLPGADVVTASSGLVTGTTTVTVQNTAPTVATPAAAGSLIVAGNSTTLSVLGADDGGESNLTYTWAATVKPLGSNPTFTINGTNAAKNDTVTFNAPGAYTFTVTITDAGGLSATSTTAVTVLQTLSHVTVTPGTASLNLNGTQQFNASGTDQFGNAMLVSPTFAWTDSGVGSISATGLYTSGTTAGNATITATSGGVSNTAAVTVTNAAPTIAVAATATPVLSNTSTLAVLGADDGGEANLTYTWVATSKPAGSLVTFSANGTNAAKATTATFNRAGTYVLTANVSDGTTTTPSSVTVVVGQNVTTINVSPNHGSVNLNGTQQFTAAAFDQFNQAMTTPPTFTWAVTGTAGGSVSSTGLYTASTTAGNASVIATAAGKTGSATVTVANAAPTVATPAAANPGTVTGTTTALSVLGADDGGAANLTYTWAATTEPNGAAPSFSANGTNGAKATTVTFNEAGTYTFTATITDAGGLTATSAVNVTVAPTLTSIAVSPGSSVTPINGTQQFAAVADDQFGNALATQPTFTWGSTVGSVNSTGLYTAPATVGLATITASTGGISGTATDLAIGSPTIQSSVDASGTSVHLSVVGIGDPSVAVTWSVLTSPAGAGTPTFTVNGTPAAQSTVLNLNAAGTYTVQAVENGNTIFKTVTVSQQLSSLSVSPSTATLSENGTQQFTAAGYDQFGAAMTTAATASWAVTSGSGSINASGLYTAPAAPGSAWITASAVGSSGSTITGTASVTINNAAPTIATAPAATPNPTLTTTTNLSVLGADDGGEANLTYTWATTGTNPAAVSFSANGTNAAKATTATFTKAGTYTFDVAISDGTNTTTSSTVTVVVVPVLGGVTVNPSNSNLNENAAQQFTAAATDQFGNLMTGQSITWSLGLGSVGTISNTGLYTAPNGTGTATVIATDGLSQGTAAVTVTNAAPVLTTVAAANPSPTTGTTAALSVLATDDGHAAGGGTDLTYTWSALSEPAGATPAFSANGTAAADNTTVTFNKPGNYTFQASITDGSHTITSNVNETVVPTLTTLSINPATATLNENATQTFTVTGLDQFGNPLASQPSVVWSSTGVGSINASSGVFTSAGATGTATVTASVNSLTATATATVVNAAPTVAQAAAANPGTVTGTTTNLTVLGADDGGEANLTYTWAATTQPTGANVTYASNATNGAKNTTATFNEAGNYTFTVTISDGTNTVTSSVPVTVQQTVSGFALTPPNPTVDENGVVHFSTSQVDQFGNPMTPPAPATWAVTAGTGTIDSNGTYTAPGSPETDTVTATVNGVTQTLTFNVTNAPPTITAQASANPANVTGTTSSLSVTAVDDGGASNLTYTWAATTAPTGAHPVFNDNGDNTAANTIVTFNEAGSYTFQVTVSDGTNSVTSSVNVTVQQTLTSIGVTPSGAQLAPDASQQFTATGVDQYGNPIAPAPSFTWSNTGTGSVDQTGNYNAGGTPGASLVTVTSGGVTAIAPVTVLYTAPSVATPATATPNPVTGTTTALAVLGADAAGESHLTYTWAATAEPAGAHPSFSVNGTNAAKDDTVTFDEAGEYTFTATISDGTSNTTSSVNVEVDQTATSLALTPPSAVVRPSNTVQFTGTVGDQFADPMSTQPTVNYAVSSGAGTVDTTGLYTAPTAQGTAAVTATADGLTATAPIRISNSIPSVSVAATANPDPVTGFRTTLSVQGADTAGEQYLTYTWAMTAGPAGAAPTFSANGSNAAKHSIATFNEAGTYTFTVTLSDGTNTVTSSVNVTVVPTASGITVTPATGTLNDGDTQQFSASLNRPVRKRDADAARVRLERDGRQRQRQPDDGPLHRRRPRRLHHRASRRRGPGRHVEHHRARPQPPADPGRRRQPQPRYRHYDEPVRARRRRRGRGKPHLHLGHDRRPYGRGSHLQRQRRQRRQGDAGHVHHGRELHLHRHRR